MALTKQYATYEWAEAANNWDGIYQIKPNKLQNSKIQTLSVTTTYTTMLLATQPSLVTATATIASNNDNDNLYL